MTGHEREFSTVHVDALVIGAGFGGIYALHRLREAGFDARAVEAGSGVGGTWFWNRYPGARCDARSLTYSYSCFAFPDLEQDWHWSEKYAAQSEIESYLNYVVDRFELRDHMTFDAKVVEARYHDESNDWRVRLSTGDMMISRHVVLATGGYSAPVRPDITGLDEFDGELYFTADWPKAPVDFAGKRIGVIGTGASGAQLVAHLSKDKSLAQIDVFQRTPNFIVPSRNEPTDPEFERKFKLGYRAFREMQRGIGQENAPQGGSSYGVSIDDAPVGPILGLTDDEFRERMDAAWAIGGSSVVTAITDLYVDERADARVREYFHERVKAAVDDPEVAELLCSQDHYIGTRRTIFLDGYVEAFNEPHINLIDIRRDPIVKIEPTGIQTTKDDHELDMIICATGFDSVTGSILRAGIIGRNGKTLNSHWAEGPSTYLGLMSSEFPNLFMITGPGSPNIRSQVVYSIEQHVEWVTDLLVHARESNAQVIEATPEAESAWTEHVADTADKTLLTKHDSQYLGANIPGKPRVYQVYVGGQLKYRKICEAVAGNGYEGVIFSGEKFEQCTSRTWSGPNAVVYPAASRTQSSMVL